MFGMFSVRSNSTYFQRNVSQLPPASSTSMIARLEVYHYVETLKTIKRFPPKLHHGNVVVDGRDAVVGMKVGSLDLNLLVVVSIIPEGVNFDLNFFMKYLSFSVWQDLPPHQGLETCQSNVPRISTICH